MGGSLAGIYMVLYDTRFVVRAGGRWLRKGCWRCFILFEVGETIIAILIGGKLLIFAFVFSTLRACLVLLGRYLFQQEFESVEMVVFYTFVPVFIYFQNRI